MKKRRSAVGKLIEDYKANKKEAMDVNETTDTNGQETLTMISDVSEMEDIQVVTRTYLVYDLSNSITFAFIIGESFFQ